MPGRNVPAKRGPETAIAKLVQPVARLEELAPRMEELHRVAHVLTPLARVDYLLPMHQVSLRVVKISPEIPQGQTHGEDVYFDPRFCRKDSHGRPLEVAPGKIALTKLMNAAGIQQVGEERLDQRRDPYLCEVEVTLGMRNFDGQWVQRKARKETDLRDGAPDTLKPERLCKHDRESCSQCQWRDFRKTGRTVPMADSALAERRKHILSLTSTKALERGVRLMLSLKQKYTVEELATKPFVIPCLVPDLDPSDPETKQALLGVALGSSQAVFGTPPASSVNVTERMIGSGPASAPALPEAVEPQDVEPQEPGHDADGPPPDEASPAPAAPDDFEPPEPPSPEIHVCACPCGCQAEVTAKVAQMTTDYVGANRCRLCYPGQEHYDLESHRDLRTLGLPSYPELTPQEAVSWRRSS